MPNEQQSAPGAIEQIARQARQSLDDYIQAVKTLLTLARGDTHGSKPAAMVLLSAYDSYRFKVGIADLCALDLSNYEAAMTVITSRVQLRIGPHQLFNNGDEVFQSLAGVYASR